MKIQTTSADIFAERTITGNKYTATTVSFSIKNSFNNLQKQYLFNTNGLIPEGFDVSAIRMIKNGQQNFKYYIKAITENNNTFCDSLKLNIINKDLSNVYDGSLNSALATKTISADGKENLITFIEMNNDSQNLKGQICNFQILIRTYKVDPDEQPMGLYAEAQLQNTITSGDW